MPSSRPTRRRSRPWSIREQRRATSSDSPPSAGGGGAARVPGGADGAGDGAAPAGTHAARCRNRSSQGGGGQDGSDGSRPGIAGGATAALRARRPAGGAPAFERPVYGDADGRRLRGRPPGGFRDYALARRRHGRRLGG